MTVSPIIPSCFRETELTQGAAASAYAARAPCGHVGSTVGCKIDFEVLKPGSTSIFVDASQEVIISRINFISYSPIVSYIRAHAMVLAFGNVTDHTTPWVASPTVRGSWDLLSSCIITISLCAWTALHLNVPEHGTASRQWLWKTKWLVLGLVAPEMVVYAAWRQRREATRLLQDVRKYLGQPEPLSTFRRIRERCRLFSIEGLESTLDRKTTSAASSPATITGTSRLPRPDWTMVHGFYVVMGGFAVDSSDATEDFLPDGRKRATITPEGLLFLLEHEPDLLPDISETQIKDKSKADGLKKFLVCIQALWFCTSCIARLATKLPISLLELNAMGHAACALLIYIMWWEKPLDVDEPTLIRGFRVQPLLAYMWMSSIVSAKNYKSYDMRGRLRDEFDAIWMYQYPRLGDLKFGDCGYLGLQTLPRVESSNGTVRVQNRQGKDIPMPASNENEPDTIHYEMSSLHYGSDAGSGVRYRLINWLHTKTYLSIFGIRFPAGLGVRKMAIDHILPADVVRWQLAYNAIERYNLEGDVRFRHYARSVLYDHDSRVKARIENLVSLTTSRPYEVWFGLAVAGVLYGGLHMLAWNAPLSSRLEQILWRVAASSVTFTPLILTPVALLCDKKALGQGGSDLVKLIRGKYVQRVNGSALFWVRIIAVTIVIPIIAAAPILWISYVLGRVYLVVECFKNVVDLPEGVYKNVAWSAYLPHIN